MPKKAGKKGKGKKKEEVVIETTRHILKERTRCMCPILGSAYHWNNVAGDVKLDSVMFKLQRAIDKGQAVLDLSDAALQHLPKDIKSIPDPALITDLNLADNNLFNGDQLFDVLGGLSDLRRLDLSRNYLNGLLSGMCSTLSHLVEIRLDGNQLTELPPQVGSWERLQYLSLANNEITALPTEVGRWRDAEYVNLRNNKLRDLPSSISAWTRLKALFLGNNQLTCVPSEVEVMHDLVELDLRKNGISSVPPELAQCTSLVKLHLGDNKVSSFPGEILGELRQMGELHLYKNRLTEVPAEIGLLVNLYRLSLSSNNLRSLPEEIGQCTKLTELYINNCAKFSGFPAAAGHLKRLQELSLKKCPALKSLPASVLEWENLRELDVRAAKKQVCKLPPELVMWLTDRKCVIRGGVPQKPKAAGKKK